MPRTRFRRTVTLEPSMERLRPDETELRGSWITVDEQVVADANSGRIDRLVADDLLKLATADGGWSTLFRDPIDGRYWELIHPRGEMHGGGPRALIQVNYETARRKYELP
jgi:hypothetical protein